MITHITHIYTIVAAKTGEIVRYVLAPAAHAPLLFADEVVGAQTLADYFGVPVEIASDVAEYSPTIADDLAGRLLAVLEQHGPAVVEALPQLKLIVVRPTAGEQLAAAFWSATGTDFD